MKKTFFVTILFFLLLVGGGFWWLKSRAPLPNTPLPASITKNMQILSPVFLNNQNIPGKFTCDGDSVNPPLEFKDVPKEAVSLALIMDDPDAPAGTWVHWTLWNMDPATTGIAENSVPPKAIAGQTSSGQNVYGGPCPPLGQHRYFFKLYALDIKLSLSSFSLKEELEKTMQGHVIMQAELVGLYDRIK